MKRNKLFLVFTSIIMSVVMLLISGGSIYAASSITAFNLKVEEYRKETSANKRYTYRILHNGTQEKKVWKITRVDGSNNSIFSEGIYCLNAEQGFIDDAWASRTDTYNYSLDMKNPLDKAALNMSYWPGSASYYNEVLWLLDNAYIPGLTTSVEDRERLLTQAGLVVDTNAENVTLLTQDDIDVVQQMAIWYFTNANNPIYHTDEGGLPVLKALQVYEIGNPSQVIDIERYQYRQTDAIKLYRYLIQEAKENASDYSGSEIVSDPVKLDNTTVKVELNGTKDKYIIGPYKLTKQGDYKTFTASISGVSGYGLLNASKQETSQSIEEMMGQNFYISVPVGNITNKTTIKFEMSGTYADNNVTFYTRQLDAGNVQPVVEIEKGEKEFEGEKEITLEPWNLEIVKVEAGTQTPIQGVTFGIQTSNGINQTLVTDGNGKINISNIIGVGEGEITITIQETATKTGYILNNTVKTIKVKRNADGSVTAVGSLPTGVSLDSENKQVKLTMENEKVQPWDLEVIKIDKETKEAIEGVEFKVTVTDKQDRVIATNSEGKINIENILGVEEGSIRISIEEVAPKSGYKPNTEIKTIELTRNADGSVTVVRKSEGIQITGNQIKVTIENEKIKGKYSFELVKVDKEDHSILLNGAIFKIEIYDAEDNLISELYKTTTNGTIHIKDIVINEAGTHRYVITELTPPANYEGISEPIEMIVTTRLDQANYTYIAEASLVKEIEGVGLEQESNTITLEVENKFKSGVYSFEIIKYKKGTQDVLKDAEFKVEVYKGNSIVKTYDNLKTDGSGRISIANLLITEEGSYRYVITETKAPGKYIGIEEAIEVNVEIEEDEEGEYVVTAELAEGSEARGIRVNKNVITIEVENAEFDLALRKFITGINVEADGTGELKAADGKYIREPEVKDLDKLARGEVTTASYVHPKYPVSIKAGDKVIYTIRIYNEGGVDGYAKEVTDYLPEQLEFVVNSSINASYGWSVQSGTNGRVIKTDYLKKGGELDDEDIRENGSLLKAFDGNELDYIDLRVECKVKDSVKLGDKITNLAAITEDSDAKGNEVIDRDSEPETFELPEDENLPNYKDEEITKEYVPGQQDDDDFEKLIVEVFDLSLRKHISKILSGEVETRPVAREPIVDTTKLNTVENGKLITTAQYNHSKTPINVSKRDIIEYTITVYNEGSIDGYVEEIVDHLPPELKYIDNEFNRSYGWEEVEGSQGRKYKTGYLSKANSTEEKENLIEKFDKEERTTLDKKEVKIQLELKEEVKATGQTITNIAEITKAVDASGIEVIDRDSTPDSLTKNNSKETDDIANDQLPTDEELPTYKDSEIGKSYIPGQQDDDDFEKIRLIYFDLALRKFITKINEETITSRIPEVSIDEDATRMNNRLVYDHPKTEVPVELNDVVIYTIRVYNEGLMDGYAAEVKDDMPEGIEYLPEHEINIKYGWEVVENAETGKEELRTDYLSKEKESTAGENLIKAFDFTKEVSEQDPLNPDYKEVQVAFKVTKVVEKTGEGKVPEEAKVEDANRVIINTAEITKDTDAEGNEVDDIDSIPDNDNEWKAEDDLDKEFLIVKYFDLSLRKWVTQAIIIEDGVQEIRETGHTAEDDPEKIVAVDLGKKDPKKVEVKFRYSIRVKNEGEIAGYVKEIKDYIPEGLKFIPEENQSWVWYDEANNIVVTDVLRDELMQPGETRTVEIILKWEAGYDVKVNQAEISKDYNESGTPDIDSTPDNKKAGEDDIDDAPVQVVIHTGEARIYFVLSGIILATIVGGILLMKRYVM